jgi:AAA ATPase domain
VIGKSRLVEVLRQQVVGEGSPHCVFQCSPYHTHSALYPVIEHVQRWLAWGRDETPAAKLDTLERALAPLVQRLPAFLPTFPRQLGGDPLAEVVPLVAALLSVPLPKRRYPPLLLNPQQQRQRTLDALVVWLLAEAERQPVLAVWEDLHWADPSTRELGEQLSRLAQRAAAPTSHLEAHDALGSTLFFLGDYAAAWSHLEQGITLTDPSMQQVLALHIGEAPGVRCLAYAALTLWCLGYPAQAVRRSQEALGLARELAHAHSFAYAQHFGAFLHYRRREAPAVQGLAHTVVPERG